MPWHKCEVRENRGGDRDASIARAQIADRVGHLIARREVIRAQRRLDAERWLDDGVSYRSETVALAPREAKSRDG